MTGAILKKHPDKPFRMHAGCRLGSGDKSAGHSRWATWNLDHRVE